MPEVAEICSEVVPALPEAYQPLSELKNRDEIDRWLREHYAKLENGGFEYIGSEPNADEYTEEKWKKARLRICIARLSTYRSTDCSMTHPLLNQLIHMKTSDNDNHENIFVDFTWLPPHKDYDAFVKNGISPWFGITSKHPVKDFDLLVVSHAVCMERLNYPRLLKYSGIPLFKKARMQNNNVPIIIMGGANCYSVEDFYGTFDGSEEHSMLVDGTVVGAGEYSLCQIRDRIIEGKQKELTKEQTLKTFHGFVHGFYEGDKYYNEYGPDKDGDIVLQKIGRKVDYVSLPVVKARVSALNNLPSLMKSPVWYSGGTGGAADVEIARGCPCFCSFCQESFLNKPYIERSAENILNTVAQARKYQGVTQANLYAFNWNHHSEIYEMITQLMAKMGKLNLISNRLDVQSQDPALATLIKEAGNSSSTVGLEGVSERMRAFLHKSLTETQTLAGAKYLMASGLSEVKFFMIVTGYETEEDIMEFCSLLRRLNQIRKEGGHTTQLRVSFMPIFCAPGTPLQFYSCESAWQLKRRTLDPVVETCRANKFGFRTGAKRSEIEISQLLEMADRRICPQVLKSSIEDEYVFYGMVPKEQRNQWETRLKEAGLSWQMYFKEKHLSTCFPWDHLYMGVDKVFLWQRYGDALNYIDHGYCLTMLRKKAKCHQCGGCQTAKHVKDIVVREVEVPKDRHDIAAFRRNMENVRPARFLLEVTDPMMRVVPKRFFNQAIPRSFMLVDDKLDKAYVEVKGHSRLTASVNDQKDWVYGKLMVDVAFNDPTITEDYLKAQLGEFNKNLRGMQIIDVRVDAKYRIMRSDVDLALYQVSFSGANALSYAKIKHGIEKYFHALSVESEFKIRKGSVLSVHRLDSKGGTIGTASIKEIEKLFNPDAREKVLVTFLDSYGDNREKNAKGVITSFDEKSFSMKQGGLTIKKKVVAMKGAFRTATLDLDRSKIVMVNAQFTETGTVVTYLADNRLNPYALLETLLGGKQWQYRPFPVKVLGYYNKTEEKQGEVTNDLRAIIRAKRSAVQVESSACKTCSGPIEMDAFTGALYKSQNIFGTCVSCDMNQGEVMDQEVDSVDVATMPEVVGAEITVAAGE